MAKLSDGNQAMLVLPPGKSRRERSGGMDSYATTLLDEPQRIIN